MLRRFYAPPSARTSTHIRLDAQEAHHLKDVLRLTAGDQVSVFDGEGNELVCEIENSSRSGAELKILKQESKRVESDLQITLYQAIVKGEKFDLVVQKATELGVNRIVPVMTAHSDVKPDRESSSRKLERWRRIALEATKQSGRTRLIEIQPPISFSAALETKAGLKFLFAERGGTLLHERKADPAIGSVAILIGPEGGWQSEEIEQAKDASFEIVTIGPRILRTETAAITAVSLIQFLLGDLSKASGD
ncbi:MAG TPA: 16S rRNA (uracil(1498)-N(3))-methyltransferase [Blastocatellia bacterium]|nr:16S rRNA (uracil(1498)-N(3))-methyltransferase [Blastocatellia bacterium]